MERSFSQKVYSTVVIFLKYSQNVFFLVKTLMRIHVLIIMVSFALSIIPYRTVYSEGQIDYTIQINSNGSANWIIIQVVDINASLDTWEEFQNRVASLVEAAKNKTAREMTAEVESMSFTPSGSYVLVEYKFIWENFSKTENEKIIIGDVFQVENFFLQLYGDGEVYIKYPSEYIVETVSPQPYERDDSHQTLRWVGTNDLTNEPPIIILKEKTSTPGFLEFLQQNSILIVSLVAIASGSSIGFYTFKRHKKREKEMAKRPELPSPLRIESDEEKIVKLLKSSGGSLYQFRIVDECKFSKAKVSQLLAALEDKGIVSRYKKGRAKIVSLVEKDK